jgi:hypothetical protein
MPNKPEIMAVRKAAARMMAKGFIDFNDRAIQVDESGLRCLTFAVASLNVWESPPVRRLPDQGT